MSENKDEVEYDPSALEQLLRKKELLKEKEREFTPFIKRKDFDWSDITPQDQFSSNVQILKMDYDPKFKEISNYFRAILHKNEISPRALALTSELIQVNSTNYMAWYHRRQCIDNMEIDLQKELNWLDDIGVVNQKNYQIWHHRKVVIEKLNDPSHEKVFLDKVFNEEPKNFHAWCHRIWVVRRFKLFEGEFDYVEKMLNEDIRNNSVWNYRFFLVTYLKQINTATLNEEIEYTFEKIKIVPNNESPYNYIRGFFTNPNISVNFKLIEFPQVKKHLEEVIEKDPNSVYAHSFMLEWYDAEKNLAACQNICDLLAEKLDVIRKKYWMWKKLNLNKN